MSLAGYKKIAATGKMHHCALVSPAILPPISFEICVIKAALDPFPRVRGRSPFGARS
jgi:hypothetical protein